MDIPDLIHEIDQSLDTIESELGSAEQEASHASGYANEASSYAAAAEEYADNAVRRVNDAQEALSTLRDEFSQLVEQVEALIAKGTDAEAIKENPAHSDLQRDMNKHKEKVLRLHNEGANTRQIAQKLGIGEFLVSRILESTQAAKVA